MRKLLKRKVFAKGAEPTAIMTLLAVILTMILQRKGIAMTEENALEIIVGVAAGAGSLYGAFRAIRNYVKNR